MDIPQANAVGTVLNTERLSALAADLTPMFKNDRIGLTFNKASCDESEQA